MTRFSLTSRILLAYTLVFSLLLTAFALLIYRSSADAELSILEAKLERFAADVRGEVEEERGDIGDYEEPISPESLKVDASDLPGARCRLVAPGGQILAPDTVLSFFSVQDDSSIHPSGRFTATYAGTSYRVVRVATEIDERAGYLLEVAAPMTEAEGRLARLRMLLFISVPASLFLAALAAYWITRSALRPIAAMTTTARSLSASNLDERIAVPPARDEVRTLAETLNGLIERIDGAFRGQKQFIADASHELRTPLTVITTELEFAEQRARGNVKESIHIALTETERLAHIADRLLLLARLDASSLPLRHEPVRLDELLAECVQHMMGAAEKKKMRLDLNLESPVEMTGDQAHLRGVIMNLLDNAIRYSANGTAVIASLEKGKPGVDFVTMRISDQGYGISPEEIPKIFQRFYRPATSRGDETGSGLGLAIVDRIVRLHGGKVSVSSTLGTGSVFTVCFPMTGRS